MEVIAAARDGLRSYERVSGWCAFAAFCSCGVGALILGGRWMHAGTVDDAYIFLRYARNLAHGAGAVFNIGERVEGVSSPLWTLILASADLLTRHLELAAIALSLLATVVTAALVAAAPRRAAWRADPFSHALIGAAFLLSPAVVFWTFSGMEEMLFTLLVTGVLVASIRTAEAHRVRPATAGLLSLALVARPEGALLAAWVFVHACMRRGRLDPAWLRHAAGRFAAAGLPLVALVMVRWGYFHSVVPNTYYAKVTPDTIERWIRGAAYLRRCLASHAGLLAAAAMLLAAAVRLRTVPWATVGLPLGWIGLWCAYVEYVGGDHFAMSRFFLPCLPAILLVITVSWDSIGEHASLGMRRVFRVVLVAGCVWSVHVSLRLDGRRAMDEPRMAQRWAVTGRWLEAHTPPDTLVATNVIGAIGYYSERRVLDMIGLTDPVIARRGAVYGAAAAGHARYDTDYVYERAPDLVVYYTSARQRAPVFTPAASLLPSWHYALRDFVQDRRCRERYEHIAVPLPDGTFIEMQKKKSFALDVPYLRAPDDVDPAASG